MLGMALDVIVLMAIVSLLARQNLSSEWFRFALVGMGVAIGGFLIILTRLPAALVLLGYFALVSATLRFIVGTTWIGSLLAAAIFVAYRLAFSAIFN